MSENISTKDLKQHTCSICGDPIEFKHHPVSGDVYWTQGNNAGPVNEGRCCDTCNDPVVLPKRLDALSKGVKTASV